MKKRLTFYFDDDSGDIFTINETNEFKKLFKELHTLNALPITGDVIDIYINNKEDSLRYEVIKRTFGRNYTGRITHLSYTLNIIS